MSTLILRTVTPFLTALMAVFSIFVTLRGHNEPGGGFIGGLIAASAIALYAIACGVAETRRALRAPPLAIAAGGVLMAALSGLASLLAGQPYLTSQWLFLDLVSGAKTALSTPLVFDLGVYLCVTGTIAAIALELQDGALGAQERS